MRNDCIVLLYTPQRPDRQSSPLSVAAVDSAVDTVTVKDAKVVT